MTKGTSAPLNSMLNGEFEVVQKTAATDIMTLTGASGQSGDFLVCNANGTEVLTIDVSGNVIPSGYVATKHATTTISLANLGTNGALGVGILTGTAQLYFRQNGTLYRIAGTAA